MGHFCGRPNICVLEPNPETPSTGTGVPVPVPRNWYPARSTAVEWMTFPP